MLLLVFMGGAVFLCFLKGCASNMKSNAGEKVTKFVGSCWKSKGIKMILRILSSMIKWQHQQFQVFRGIA